MKRKLVLTIGEMAAMFGVSPWIVRQAVQSKAGPEVLIVGRALAVASKDLAQVRRELVRRGHIKEPVSA